MMTASKPSLAICCCILQHRYSSSTAGVILTDLLLLNRFSFPSPSPPQEEFFNNYGGKTDNEKSEYDAYSHAHVAAPKNRSFIHSEKQVSYDKPTEVLF
jgi:hypothetical protein